jgi:hypothetical protein
MIENMSFFYFVKYYKCFFLKEKRDYQYNNQKERFFKDKARGKIFFFIFQLKFIKINKNCKIRLVLLNNWTSFY